MIATALVFASRINLTKTNKTSIYIAALGLIAIIFTRATAPTLTFAIGVPIAIGVVALALIPKARETSVSALIVLIAILSAFQLLQNSRTHLGIYYLSP